MEIIIKPRREEYQVLLQRPHKGAADLNALVSSVLEDVKKRGDAAIREYELKFDHVQLHDLQVTDAEICQAASLLKDELKDAIHSAHENIARFHQAQRMKTIQVETAPGVFCSQKSVPIQKVGLYIPGGTAPLFSTVLMLATPARIAGCQEIILCSPPDSHGQLHPAILYAAKVAGVNRIYKCGGVQAIGAMAYGTESIPRVSKIFGPGNQFVTCAKQHVSLHDVAIDMPAGPSEVAIIADKSANPVFVAADMLSQAEHGRDSQAVLFTDSEILAHKVVSEAERQLAQLSRKELAEDSLSYSRIFVLKDINESFDICNEYAPEHLIIAMDDAINWADKVINAGSVFLGHYSCESAGDYASGTNHTLPTSGYAKAYSGVNLDSFCRKITFQNLTADGIRSIGRTVELMAEAEGLDAHRNAMTYRINKVTSKS
ncbi:MAG: histidinol dehydrogenase [Bacteroidaceae bacterium]|nr:histidinol dehydrogenase [Bacteroidaceae bacterium]